MAHVSVVIPAYKAELTISRPVNSLLSQTHREWEAIIVADDIQDYRAILYDKGITDSRLRFAATGKTGSGPGAARNIGLDMAAYPIIAHLDADDAYGENYLAEMMPLAQAHGACNSSVRLIDAKTGEEMPLSGMPADDMALTMPYLLRRTFGYANIIIDRKRCSARWPEDIHYGEDILFWLLILDELPAIYFHAKARYDYYYRKGSLSRPDEKDTHGLCARRDEMRQWLMQARCPLRNATTREFMISWLQSFNEAEEIFGYQLVEPDVFKAEMDKRLEALFSRSGY